MELARHTQDAAVSCGNNPNHVRLTQMPRSNGQWDDEKIHSMHHAHVNHREDTARWVNSRDAEGHSDDVVIRENGACTARRHVRHDKSSGNEGFYEHAERDGSHQH
jgi:hypothetical protein